MRFKAVEFQAYRGGVVTGFKLESLPDSALEERRKP